MYIYPCSMTEILLLILVIFSIPSLTGIMIMIILLLCMYTKSFRTRDKLFVCVITLCQFNSTSILITIRVFSAFRGLSWHLIFQPFKNKITYISLMHIDPEPLLKGNISGIVCKTFEFAIK